MTRNETAMAAAFKRAGLSEGTRLHAMIAELLKDAGGGRAKVRETLRSKVLASTELLDALLDCAIAAVAEDMQGKPAYEMPGGGHEKPADEATAPVPPTRQQNGGEAGSPENAHEGSVALSRPASDSRGAGAQSPVPKGHVAVSPVREPSAAQKRAAKAVAKVEALTVLDRFKLTERNGAKTVIGDIRIDRLDSLGFYAGKRAFVAEHESKLTYLIKREIEKFPHVPEDARVRDILDPKTVERLIEEAKELAGAKRVLPAEWAEAINA